jgi:hypothetical protein
MNFAQSKNPYRLGYKKNEELDLLFNSGNSKSDYKILKNILRQTNCSVPTLYKHYSDLCKEGGVSFLDFCIDPDFENCVDGLILVNVDMIKEEKKQRYIKTEQAVDLRKPA